MSSPNVEHYTVLQLLFIPDKTDEQPTKLIRLKDGADIETILKGFKPGSVYAWRTFEKEVSHGGVLGFLLASEEARNHTPWKFIQGKVFSMEEMSARMRPSAIAFHRNLGKTHAVVVKDDMVVFVGDDADVSAIS